MVHIIPLNYQKISTTNPLVVSIKPDQCYYWVNDKQEFCIALREMKGSILGKPFERELNISFVLQGLPAGPAGNYRVIRKTFRSRYRAGYTHTRSTSLSGIVALWNDGAGSLQGRFRIIARQQAYSILTGWGKHRHVLFVGEFSAVENAQRGIVILARTQEDGLSRKVYRTQPRPINSPPRKNQDAVKRIPKTH